MELLIRQIAQRVTESDLADAIGRKSMRTLILLMTLQNSLQMKNVKPECLYTLETIGLDLLETLALEVDDNGAYIDQVKQKFNADAANWVWNSETADEKIGFRERKSFLRLYGIRRNVAIG